MPLILEAPNKTLDLGLGHRGDCCLVLQHGFYLSSAALCLTVWPKQQPTEGLGFRV